MDVCEPEKHAAVDTPRPPFSPAERNNAVTTRRPRTREVSSRYKSSSPATPSNTRRSPSPNLTRTVPSNSLLVPKRAVSAERNRPSTPPSPQRPSTPIRDSSVDSQFSSRRMSIGGGRLPESLWPSTMRSLGVSFQSDIISIPVSKKEKPVNSASLDRTLRPSSNVGHKQTETPSRARKPTPDRKRSPQKGRNSHDQSENAKPVDGLHSRLIDQHRWPSRMGGKLSSSSLNRSVDFTDKSVGNSAIPSLGIGLSSWRRTPTTDSMANLLKKSVSDANARLLLLDEIGSVASGEKSIDDSSLQLSRLHKFVSPSLSDRTMLATPVAKSQPLPTTRSRPASPSRISGVSSSIVKVLSPSRTRPSTPPSRVSPSRIRPSSSSCQASNSTSVLSFIADFKKGKKGAGFIEDAHHLRLIYNRYLQWRFVNARAEAVLYIQKVIAEKTLYNVWNNTLSLWESIIRKRINLQQLKLDLKLNSVLNDQMGYLDDWGLLEREHISSLSGALDDLEASTLRLPVTGGATANIEYLKIAICSAVDVMQAMGSSICSLLSRVEGINTLVSELAVVAAQENAMLDECESLLASTAAKQVEEYSFRTNLIQTKQALEKDVNFLEMNIPA